MTSSALAAFAASSVFPIAMMWAGLTDLTSMTIRNGLVLFLLAAYLVLAPLAGFGAGEIGRSVVVALAILAGAFLMFARGWIGGGDAKLVAAASLWLGADQVVAYLGTTALLGGILALGLLLFRRLPLPAALGTAWVAQLHRRDAGIPYGVALGLAAIAAFPETSWARLLF
ncbi:A24 family peptidase [Inquilinus sp. OTU3971]|uniref:A24 family peptidase n=1 Tax=Inquilinus sp. OTU3971 TaxID=3043855 RepID=UPI00313F114A